MSSKKQQATSNKQQYCRMSHVACRWLLVACCLSLVSQAGCGSLKKKFIRPSRAKPPPAVQLHYEEKTYERLPNRVQYEEAFLLWRVWHSESLNALTHNQKRARTGLKQALEQLTALRGLLTGRKADELSVHLERLQKVQGEFERGRIDSSTLDHVRMVMEKELRLIHTSFSVDQVEGSLLPDS